MAWWAYLIIAVLAWLLVMLTVILAVGLRRLGKDGKP